MKLQLQIMFSLASILISSHCIPIDVHGEHTPAVVVPAVATGDVHLLPAAHQVEFDAHPKYEFTYGVKDPLTGDDKEHHESRDGDVVHGSYSLVEPDGSRRIVDYTADDVHGFNAVVRRDPPHVPHIQQEASIVAAVAHQPLITTGHHPVAHLAATEQHLPVTLAHHAPITHQATYEFSQQTPTIFTHVPTFHAPAAYVHHVH